MKTSKHYTHHPLRIVLFLLLLTLSSATAYSTSFTAVASGNWSSTLTWGGVVPTLNNVGDVIIIPVGINVKMDGNITMDGVFSQMTIAGSLNADPGISLTMNGGNLNGSGSLTVDSLKLGGNAVLTYAGTISANTLVQQTSYVSLTAQLTVKRALNLNSGILAVSAGGSLTMGPNTMIEIAGGRMIASGGSFGLSSFYTVRYTGNSVTAGVELSGSGFTNMVVELWSGASLTLSSDLEVKGALSLNSGVLSLNGNDLTITGGLTVQSNGFISSTSASSITINASEGVNGIIRFMNGQASVNDFNIDVGSTHLAKISGTLIVFGTLNLNSGTLDFRGGTLSMFGGFSGGGKLAADASSSLNISSVAGISSPLSFTSGGAMVNSLRVNVGSGKSVHLASELTVASELVLDMSSNLDISDVSLTLNGSLSGSGKLIVNGGTDLTLNSNSGMIFPLALLGNVMGSLTVNVGSTNSILLGSALTLTRSLNLQSGVLVLNGNNLTLRGTVGAQGSGSLSSTSASNIAIITTQIINGSLRFSDNGAVVKNFTVDVSEGNSFRINGKLNVTGTLELTSGILDFLGAHLSIGGAVSGSGALSADGTSNLTVTTPGGVQSTLNFGTGTTTLNNLTIDVGSANAIAFTTDLVVKGMLQLQNGSDINVRDKSLTISGNLGGSGSIVVNENSGIVINAENAITQALILKGESVGNFTLNVGTANRISVGSSLVVQKVLSLQSGTLVLNNNNLTVNGSVNATEANGQIAATATSDIQLNIAASPRTMLRFDANAHSLKNLSVNIAGGGSLLLGSAVDVQGILDMKAGFVDVGSYQLNMGAMATIRGAGSAAYIITDGGGRVAINTGSGSTTEFSFPIGVTGKYFPASLTLSAGVPNSTIEVGVLPGVRAQGDTGVLISTTKPVVDATWNVRSQSIASADMDLKVQWAAAAEVNGFKNSTAYIARNNGTSWDTYAVNAATAEGNGMFSLKRTHISSSGSYAVFDGNPADVVDAMSNGWDIYPNPASESISLRNINPTMGTVKVEIVTMQGETLATQTLSAEATTLRLNAVSSGCYFLKIHDGHAVHIRKFVKL